MVGVLFAWSVLFLGLAVSVRIPAVVSQLEPARSRDSLGRGSAATLDPEATREARPRARRAFLLGAVGCATGLLIGGPAAGVTLGAIGGVVPTLLARRRQRSWQSRLDAEVPQLLDLLAAASTAGLSASLSLTRASAAVDGPLATELRAVAARVDLGARWREELSALAARAGSADLRRVVVALSRTEALGTSLADALAELADDVRAARAAAAAEHARKAPVKMLFPLVFLVLPAFLLLTVVPVLLSTFRSLG